MILRTQKTWHLGIFAGLAEKMGIMNGQVAEAAKLINLAR